MDIGVYIEIVLDWRKDGHGVQYEDYVLAHTKVAIQDPAIQVSYPNIPHEIQETAAIQSRSYGPLIRNLYQPTISHLQNRG